MPLMLVYRYENANGIGPYMDSAMFEAGLDWTSPVTHPSPQNDPKLGSLEPLEYCGCHTRRLLRQWFPARSRRALNRLGYYLAVYDAPEVRIGSRQVAFVRKTARLVATSRKRGS